MASVNLLDENLLLWNKFRNGDADALGELMHIHYRDLLNYGTRFTKDTDMVKNCIQDLFLALWINRLTISESSFIKYDLLKSLRHNLSRTMSRSRRQVEPQFEYLFNGAPFTGTSLIREESLADLVRKMRKTLSGLSRRQQEAIYLRFYMDAGAEDIAAIMALSCQSVCNLLHDAVRRLGKVRKVIVTNVLRRL